MGPVFGRGERPSGRVTTTTPMGIVAAHAASTVNSRSTLRQRGASASVRTSSGVSIVAPQARREIAAAVAALPSLGAPTTTVPGARRAGSFPFSVMGQAAPAAAWRSRPHPATPHPLVRAPTPRRGPPGRGPHSLARAPTPARPRSSVAAGDRILGRPGHRSLLATVWPSPARIPRAAAAMVRHMPGGAPATVGPVRPMSGVLPTATLALDRRTRRGVTEAPIRSPSASVDRAPGAIAAVRIRTVVG